MKHKLKGLIVVIIIATFALQGQFGVQNPKRYKDAYNEQTNI
jgi:hypothetical protein